MMKFEFHVHGLWIFGAILLLLGTLIAGNFESGVLGSTPVSEAVALLIAFVLLLMAGLCWISAAVNARQEMK